MDEVAGRLLGDREMNGPHLSRAIDRVSTLKAPAPLTVSFMRRFVKRGRLSQLAAVADALIDAVIRSVEGFSRPIC